MKDSLCTRQVCFILMAYSAALKLIIYPAAAADAAGCDIIFPALIDLALQTAVIWAVAFLCSKTDKTLYMLLKDTFGSVAAKVVMCVLALYFLFAAIVPLSEEQLLVHAAFYDTVPTLYVFLPIFIFTVYAGAKSLKNAGRCADICLPVFAVCVAAIIGMSAGEGDYTNLLPVLKQSAGTYVRAAAYSLFRFSDGAFMLMFMGRFGYKKGDAAKITLSYAAGGLIVVGLLAVFYAVYGRLAPTRPFFLSDICVFSPAVGYVGRVDLALLYALDAVILFALALYVQMSVHCIADAFGIKNLAVPSLCANAVLVAVTFALWCRFGDLQAAAARWFWIPALIFAYILPVCCWALRRKRE